MIKGFRSKDAERIFQRQFVKKFSADVRRLAYRKLILLDSAERLGDIKLPPGNRIEKLTGNREGQHSIRLNNQWRICFRWYEGDAFDVEIADYH